MLRDKFQRNHLLRVDAPCSRDQMRRIQGSVQDGHERQNTLQEISVPGRWLDKVQLDLVLRQVARSGLLHEEGRQAIEVLPVMCV